MRGERDDVEEVRERINMVELISEDTPLKKSGQNWTGPCPFHPDKNPSFSVNEEKGVYNCFGCKASGDIFGYIMERQGASFPEALRILAERCGYPLKETEEKSSLFFRTKTFYRYVFLEKGKEHIRKEAEKNYGKKALTSLQVGYAPPWGKALRRRLIKLRASLEDLRKASLVNEKGEDTFRAELVFPIIEAGGRIVGFVSKEKSVLRRREALFGERAAKEAIKKMRKAILTEGFETAVALFSSGVENVAGFLGEGASPSNIRRLRELGAEEIYLLGKEPPKEGIERLVRAAEGEIFFVKSSFLLPREVEKKDVPLLLLLVEGEEDKRKKAEALWEAASLLPKETKKALEIIDLLAIKTGAKKEALLARYLKEKERPEKRDYLMETLVQFPSQRREGLKEEGILKGEEKKILQALEKSLGGEEIGEEEEEVLLSLSERPANLSKAEKEITRRRLKKSLQKSIPGSAEYIKAFRKLLEYEKEDEDGKA